MNSYVTAWAELAHHNNLLKFLCAALCLLCLVLSGVCLKHATQSPLIIDRGCISRASLSAANEASASEVESFVREALAQRFDTDARLGGDLLSLPEIQTRTAEQEEFKKHEIKQRIFLNSLSQITSQPNDEISADVDRFLSVGSIRSAFSFPLKLKIQKTQRSAANPYGLVLTEVKPLNVKNSDGGDKKP